MKVLVFGASGQVAQSFRTLVAPDCKIVTLGRPDGDITASANIERAIETHTPDVVVNAAAYTAVDKAESDEAGAFLVNRDGSRFLAMACRGANLPLIHYSTDYVYDGSKASPYVETDPTGPMSVYGASKLAGENAIRDTHDKHVILRTAWVFSPYGGNFVKTMLRLAADREELNVVEDQLG